MLTKASSRWVIPLCLIAGLLCFTTPADAQSRGQRQAKTEQKEAKKSSRTRSNSSAREVSNKSKGSRSSNSSKPSATRNESMQGRQKPKVETNRPSRGTSSQPARTPNTRSSANTRTTRDSSPKANRPSNTGSTNTRSTSRSSNQANQSSNTRSTANNRSTRGASNQPNRSSNTRSTANNRSTRGASNQPNRSSNTRSTANNRSTRGASNQPNRSSNTRSTANNRSTRSSSTQGTRDDNRSTRTTNNRSSSNRTVQRDSNRGRQTASNGRASSSNRSTTRQNNDRSRTVVTERNRTVQNRRDNTRVVIQPSPNRRHHGSARQVYKRKNYKHRPTLHVKRYGHKKHHYVSPVYYHRPHIQVNVTWPWQNRYHRKWKPHYRYKQVVYVNAGGHRNYRSARIDVRTDYYQEVRYADHRKAVVDIYLDRVEVYEDGYFLGEVDRIPDHLSHIEATIYRNGDIVYDKDVFLVGDSRVGFEMISTRDYNGYVLSQYDRSHGYKVGRLNFRNGRVEARRYSRLFDPYDYNSYAPISLLPEDRYLADYGYDSVSYNYYDEGCDPYYGGSYEEDYYDYYDDGSYYKYDAPRGNSYGRSPQHGRQSVQASIAAAGPIKLNNNNTVQTRAGISVTYEREAQLERIR